jgi:hypothetical protein
LDEVSTLSKYQPVSFLLQDMERKRVVVDWSNSNQPVAIIDIKPVEGWDEAHVWLGLTGSATSEANKEAFAKFCRTLFDQLNKNHRQLLYHVAASNFTQSRWLEQFGFLPHRRLSHYGDKQVEYFVLRRSPANV